MITEIEELLNLEIIEELHDIKFMDSHLDDVAETISDLTFFVEQSGLNADGTPHYVSSFNRKTGVSTLHVYLADHAYQNYFGLESDVNPVILHKISFFDVYMDLKRTLETNDNVQRAVVHFNLIPGSDVFQASYEVIELVYLMNFAEIEYSDAYFSKHISQKDAIQNVFKKYQMNPAVIQLIDKKIGSNSLIVVVDEIDKLKNTENIVSEFTKLDPSLEYVSIVPMSDAIQEFLNENNLQLKYLT